MSFYPVYLDLREKDVLLVGGGAVAWQKLPALLESGARVHLVSPDVLPEIKMEIDAQKLRWSERAYESRDVDGMMLVIAATDDPAVQQAVACDARARHIWMNVVDVPPLCDFIAPSIVSRGDLQIAISTGGAAPAMAKLLRRKLEPVIGPEYGDFVRLAQKWRPSILKLPKDRRLRLWERLASEEFVDIIRQQNLDAAEQTLQAWLQNELKEIA